MLDFLASPARPLPFPPAALVTETAEVLGVCEPGGLIRAFAFVGDGLTSPLSPVQRNISMSPQAKNKRRVAATATDKQLKRQHNVEEGRARTWVSARSKPFPHRHRQAR